MLDRRQDERYEIDGRATFLSLRDVEVQSASADAVTVLAATPSRLGAEASLRLTGPRGREVVLRVRTSACVPVPAAPKRFRVTYHVLERVTR